MNTSLDPRLKARIEEDALDTQGFERPHALMQAVGMVNDHVTGCFRHREVEKLA